MQIIANEIDVLPVHFEEFGEKSGRHTGVQRLSISAKCKISYWVVENFRDVGNFVAENKSVVLLKKIQKIFGRV